MEIADGKLSFHVKNFSRNSSLAGKMRLTWNCSAIFSTTEAEDHKTAYVKGGLFVRKKVGLPPPGAEIFWHRREKWEETTTGIKPQ